MKDVLSITGSRRGELVQLVQLAVRLDLLDVLGGLRGEAFEGASGRGERLCSRWGVRPSRGR